MGDRTDDRLRVVAGSASASLGAAVTARLGVSVTDAETERFPDGELRPTVSELPGADVFVVQSTGPPVSENLVELLLLIDACRRARADRVTAVVPYFGYARQDRRDHVGDAVAARVVADVIAAAGADRVVVVDPHTTALEAVFGVPVEMLTAVPLLAKTVQVALSGAEVVVAPDLGAAKLAEHVGALLHLPVAVVRKTRVSGTTVHADQLIGDVAGRPAVIVDDMISTGATIEAALRVLIAHGAAADVVVAATHGLFVGPAAQRLRHLSLRQLVVTDTATRPAGLPLPIRVETVAPLLADAIGRLHRGEPLDGLLVRT